MLTPVPLQSLRVRGILAGAAIGVLVIGYLLRPETDLPLPPVEEQPSPILREAVERREPGDQFAALRDIAGRVVDVTARVTVPRPARERWSDWQRIDEPDVARFGVVIDENRVLANAADLRNGTAVQVRIGGARTVRGWIVTRFASTRLALIAIDTAGAVMVSQTAPAASPGELVVGVGPGDEGPVMVPLVVSETRGNAMFTAVDTERFLGMPVFTANGRRLGVLAAGTDGMRILPVQTVLSEAPAPPVAPPVGVSLRLATNGRDAPAAIVVEDVAPSGRAAAGGLRPGDVLVAVDDTPPDTLDAAVAMLGMPRDRPLRLRIRRGTRTLVLSVPDAAEQPR